MSSDGNDARGAWGLLAQRGPACSFTVPGAEELTCDTALRDGDGGPRWIVDRIFRLPDGGYLFVRAIATPPAGSDAEVVLVPARDPDALVASLRALRDPGLVETLGRAGIEIGLEPGDEEED